MNEGWRAIEHGTVDGWTLRFSAGVTKRANSVLPLEAPADLESAVAEVERRCSERWLDATFQIGPASQPAGLDELLACRGYQVGSPTLVQIMEPAELERFAHVVPDGRIELSDTPDEDWLQVFWEQEGPVDPSDQAVSRQILRGSPAVYAALRVDGRVESIARMALVEGYGGMYCVVTRKQSRRGGYARAVMESLLGEASRRGLKGLWLQVRESNVGAIVLYNSLGFSTASQYHYRTRAL